MSAERQRAYRARKAAAEGRDGAVGRPRKHGASRYNAGCRCDICRTANTERKRAQRANRKDKT